ncbi:hypothetical protein E2C01_018304 [Portunus trituberculatus]|uniref:Uncharacterized protein n=1 Tax=Portunus trituberculatus TaxID=210409 RepID=A0A5B7DUP0_PORTR|nr:hypothetical protein [Portunus trituberculatus]
MFCSQRCNKKLTMPRADSLPPVETPDDHEGQLKHPETAQMEPYVRVPCCELACSGWKGAADDKTETGYHKSA